MHYDADAWPIAAALLQFPGVRRNGSRVQDDPPESWLRTLREVSLAGFDLLDLTDSWLQIADLSVERLRDFELVLLEASLRVPSLSITRRSIVDPRTGLENLSYAHRTIDAAAALGVQVLSIGLHQPLTREQTERLWFWTAPGAGDPLDDSGVRELAIARIRELGQHAAANDMIVSLEMYEDTYLGTADDSIDFVDAVGLSNVGLNPDVANLLRLHRSIEGWQELLSKTLPYANYWQVKNYFRDENPDSGSIVSMPAPLELGFIDYRSAIREALSLGFSGVFCCEHYGGDGLSVSARNRDYLRVLLHAFEDAEAVSRTFSEGTRS
jgi:Sugar phosphate isomerases/epimerases